MSARSRVWVATLRYAVPLVGLFGLALATNGWLSTAAWIAFFGSFVVLVVLGIRDAARPLDGVDDE